MKKRIPILPLPLDKAAKISKRFMSVGESLSHVFPALDFELEQAGFDYDPRDGCSIAVLCFLFYFILLSGLMSVIMIAARIEIIKILTVSIPVGLVIGFVSLLYLTFYPKLHVNRKIRNIEKNLPTTLHHLLIEIRSGVPLYNSLVSIAQSRYGALSDEIRKAVNEINTGKSEIAALERLARENPSLYFRRVMWQLVNSLKSGADIGDTIKNLVDALSEDQRISITIYGSALNPMALMYMLFAVIFPTLGITFLLVISSFIGIGFDVQWILLGILGFLLIFQFMIIGLIKSRRPVGI
ncbi:MAG: type II secretion system F family protein [Candidatus Aenigmatarchaeota archaeon]|nr:MAG: type II secretion system F family protein [Candidatus Aenigmarchaeota archaeon]